MGPGSVNPAGRIDQKYLCTFCSSTPHCVVEQTSPWPVLFRCRTASTPGGRIIFHGVTLGREWSWEMGFNLWKPSSLRMTRHSEVKWSEVILSGPVCYGDDFTQMINYGRATLHIQITSLEPWILNLESWIILHLSDLTPEWNSDTFKLRSLTRWSRVQLTSCQFRVWSAVHESPFVIVTWPRL